MTFSGRDLSSVHSISSAALPFRALISLAQLRLRPGPFGIRVYYQLLSVTAPKLAVALWSPLMHQTNYVRPSWLCLPAFYFYPMYNGFPTTVTCHGLNAGPAMSGFWSFSQAAAHYIGLQSKFGPVSAPFFFFFFPVATHQRTFLHTPCP